MQTDPRSPMVGAGRKPRLLDRVRLAVRTRHYSLRTEEAYVGWIRRFILFHGKRHPGEMAEAEINVLHFLGYAILAGVAFLAVRRRSVRVRSAALLGAAVLYSIAVVVFLIAIGPINL